MHPTSLLLRQTLARIVCKRAPGSQASRDGKIGTGIMVFSSKMESALVIIITFLLTTQTSRRILRVQVLPPHGAEMVEIRLADDVIHSIA